MKAGIVGLGLIGGSMGLALKKLDMFEEIYGVDSNPVHAKQALTLGLVDECVELEELKTCDLIFLAIPVEGIISILQGMTDIPPQTTVIDLGSTKERIIQNIPQKIRKNVIAAHPMSGTEKFGPHAALDGLYQDKIVVLCDTEDSGEAQLKLAKEVFIGIGMKIVRMNSREHDRHAAFISHLPHAISYALANSVLAQEDPESILTLAAGGFKDMSRIAKSSPTMWTEIFKQNSDWILESIRHFENELATCRNMVEKEDWEGLRGWMESAVRLHKIL